MNTISISKLKASPAKAIELSTEYPVAVEKRNEIKAYLIGKDLYDKLLNYIEDYVDKKAVSTADFKKGKNFDKLAKELGV